MFIGGFTIRVFFNKVTDGKDIKNWPKMNGGDSQIIFDIYPQNNHEVITTLLGHNLGQHL